MSWTARGDPGGSELQQSGLLEPETRERISGLRDPPLERSGSQGSRASPLGAQPQGWGDEGPLDASLPLSGSGSAVAQKCYL